MLIIILLLVNKERVTLVQHHNTNWRQPCNTFRSW